MCYQLWIRIKILKKLEKCLKNHPIRESLKDWIQRGYNLPTATMDKYKRIKDDEGSLKRGNHKPVKIH